MINLIEDYRSVRILGVRQYLYLRFLYRHHMRFIHKRGRHAMRHYGQLLPDGGEFDKCDWCGHFENVVPPRTPLMDYLRKPERPTPSHKA